MLGRMATSDAINNSLHEPNEHHGYADSKVGPAGMAVFPTLERINQLNKTVTVSLPIIASKQSNY